MKRGGSLAVAALVLLAAPAAARADDAAAPPAARALYDEATHAMDEKEFAAACPKLEEVVRLVPEGVGARVTLGECYEGEGRLASAWTAYNAAYAVALRTGQTARADKARAAAAALRPRLATLAIDVAPEVRTLAGLSVACDGAPVDPSSFGVAIPLDRGRHRVTASAAGRLPFEQTAAVESDGVNVKIAVDALAPAPPSMIAPAPLGAPRAEAAQPGRSPLVVVGFVTAGVGLVVGGVAGALTLSEAATCKSASGCTSSALDRAKATAWASDIGLGVGAVGAALGIVGLVASRPPPRAAATTVLRVGCQRLDLVGTF